MPVLKIFLTSSPHARRRYRRHTWVPNRFRCRLPGVCPNLYETLRGKSSPSSARLQRLVVYAGAVECVGERYRHSIGRSPCEVDNYRKAILAWQDMPQKLQARAQVEVAKAEYDKVARAVAVYLKPTATTT